MKRGNVEIILQQKDTISIYFTQVGRMEQGEFVLEFPFQESGVNLNALRTASQLEKAAEQLKSYVSEGFLAESDEQGVVHVENLEEGVYLLNSMEAENGIEMLPTLLFLPTWDELEEKMLYDVTVVPKYAEVKPQTGDEVNLAGWILAIFISAVIFFSKINKLRKKEECF